MTNKQKVVDLLKSFETGNDAPVAYINPNKYIQHNVSAPDGLAGFKAMRQLFPPGAMKVSKVRVFEDGAYVFAHMEYDFFGPKIGLEIFRFEDGLIVEHWDNLQETAGPNPSNHTMTDGPTEVADLEKTEENKVLVRQFVEDILVHGDMSKLAGYFEGDHYTQHNPHIGDGLSGLRTAMETFASQGITMRYDKVHLVLGEGNFVLVQSEGAFSSQPTAFYDLFRVENGKIAEHWDTIETILPRSEWKNNNGKF